MLKRKLPDPIDVAVGTRVRLARAMAGLSQEDLGDACGISFQQIQKYEKGTNRIGASRMLQIATATGRRVDYFYEGVTQTAEGAEPIELALVKSDPALVRQIAGLSDRHRGTVKRLVADLAAVPA